MVFSVIVTVHNIARVQYLLSNGVRPELFRLNLSHTNPTDAVAFLTQYQSICGDIPIFLDLQGSKIRLLREQPQLTLTANQEVCITAAPISGKTCILVDAQVVRMCSQPHEKPIIALIDDGKVSLRLLPSTSPSFVPAVVVQGGHVLPRKGFNLSPHPICLTELTASDSEFVTRTRIFPCVRYALSFVSDPREILALRRTVGDSPCCQNNPKGTSAGVYIACKLERHLSPAETRAIAAVSNELWLCRGDMGSQLGLPGLAQFYRAFVHVIPTLGCPVILAGEVLDHVPMAGISTRSEVCHLADAVERGYAGCVLSNETVCPSEVNALAAVRLVKDVTSAAQDEVVAESPYREWWLEAVQARKY